jgi:hypothetical protein
MPKLSDASKLYVGTTPVQKVYMGTTQVWSSFSPISVSGLTMWLDASKLGLADGADVTRWPDLSGAGRDLLPNPSYGSVPSYKTNELNGLGVVRFNGTSNLLTASGPGSIKHFFVVAKYNHATFDNYDALISGSPADGDLALVGEGSGAANVWYPPGAGSVYHYNGVEQTPPNLTAPMQAWAYMSVSRTSAWLFTVQVGLDRQYPPRYWDGDVAEVIAYDRVLTGPERQNEENYLRTKYAI